MELNKEEKKHFSQYVNIKKSYINIRQYGSSYRLLGLSFQCPLFVVYGCNQEVSDPDDLTDGETVERWEDADAQDMALTALVCEVVRIRV
jgi:hypothetical protein